MRPATMFVTREKNGHWIEFQHFNGNTVHSIKFSDGSKWDCKNGWRQDTIGRDEAEWNTLTLLEALAPKLGVRLETLQRLIAESGGSLPGPTTPTSTPTPQPSESPTPTAPTSSTHPEDILWEALQVLKKLDASYGWSLTMASAQSNTTFEASRPAAATDSAQPDSSYEIVDKLRRGLL